MIHIKSASQCSWVFAGAEKLTRDDFFVSGINACSAVVCCSLLLDAGCDVNRRTREGTALHEAVANGHVDVVSLLLTVSVKPGFCM